MKTHRLITAIAILTVVTAVSCGNMSSASGPTIEAFTFNGENIAISQADYRIEGETVYLAADMLDKYMHLKLEELVPDMQIGICTDELCIPFALEKGKPDSAFKEDDKFFIPIKSLMTSLESECDWNPDTQTLTVVYTTHG